MQGYQNLNDMNFGQLDDATKEQIKEILHSNIEMKGNQLDSAI